MFNKNFYPTPDNLIAKMFKGVKLDNVKEILEPNAGKGNIVDYIIKNYKYDSYYNKYNFNIDCVEIEPELQATLKGKGYRVVHNDFLSFNTYKKYDLIIMNPPFDNGAKHLLKALDMQKDGGSIICLLNAETLKNLCSNDRIILNQKLLEYNASIEFLQNEFCNAERKTDVEVALIKIYIEDKKCSIEDLLKNLKQENNTELYDNTSSELVNFVNDNDFIEDVVQQYQNELILTTNLVKEYFKIKPYIKKSFENNSYDRGCILSLKVKDSNYFGETSINGVINECIQELNYKYWSALFGNEKFIKNLTSNLVQELNQKLNDLKNFDFTIYNIMTIKEELIKNTIKGVEDTILNLFDEFTVKYHYFDESSKNIHYYNGWCTNKSFKINNKIILPYNFYDCIWKRIELRYNSVSKFTDIIKVFDYLAGQKNNIDVLNIFEKAQSLGIFKDIDLGYFKITVYKKGTCHITFTDLDLLEKFNLFGSQKKGWLPPHYGRKKYKDMNKAEKELVKEFSGSEENYNKIIERQDYYLNTTSNILMLTN